MYIFFKVTATLAVLSTALLPTVIAIPTTGFLAIVRRTGTETGEQSSPIQHRQCIPLSGPEGQLRQEGTSPDCPPRGQHLSLSTTEDAGDIHGRQVMLGIADDTTRMQQIPQGSPSSSSWVDGGIAP